MLSNTGRRSLRSKKIVCAHCKLDINEDKDDYIECDKCSKLYHIICTKLDKKQYEHLLKHEEDEYICQVCDDKPDAMITNQLKRMEEKLDKIDRLTESVEFMSSKFDELMKSIHVNTKRIDNVEKENTILKSEIKTLKESVKMLNDQRVKIVS